MHIFTWKVPLLGVNSTSEMLQKADSASWETTRSPNLEYNKIDI